MLAIIAAVVLVAGAVLIRSAITDDGNDQSCADGSAEDCRGGGSGRPRVACTPDLDAVCNALAADDAIEKVEPVDLADAADRADELDGWITYGVAPLLIGYDVSPNAPKAGAYDVTPTPIASARLTAVVPPGSTGAIGDKCLAKPTWTCIDAAVAGGNVPLSAGATGPISSAAITNLTPLAEAGRYGEADAVEAFDQVSGAYKDALGRGVAPSASVDTQLDQLVTQVGRADVVVAPAARATDAVRQASGRNLELRALTAEPASRAVVVLASTGTGNLSSDVEEALIVDGAPARALAKLGYRIDTDAKVPGTAEAGFLYTVWKALD